jgi:hypothetical protein
VRQLAADSSAQVIVGGTNLVDLMKYNVEQPTHLIDITHLPLHTIEDRDGGGLRLGALVSLRYDALANTSRFEDYQENDINWSGLLYTCANTKFTHQLAQLDVYTPAEMLPLSPTHRP